MSEENTTATVSERKFNGTSTLIVTGVEEKRKVKAFARRFFKDEYGHRTSKVVAEQGSMGRWTVIVADHSSGSLKGNREYEL